MSDNFIIAASADFRYQSPTKPTIAMPVPMENLITKRRKNRRHIPIKPTTTGDIS
jgi:hypothetical protein